MSEINYSKTVLLPKTDFPMKADLARREPDFLKKWQDMDIYSSRWSPLCKWAYSSWHCLEQNSKGYSC
jgi:hypothetical protein